MGAIPISVEVVAPNDPMQVFRGNVTVVNVNDSSDYGTIKVILMTPKKYDLHSRKYSMIVLEHFSNSFPKIQLLLQRLNL